MDTHSGQSDYSESGDNLEEDGQDYGRLIGDQGEYETGGGGGNGSGGDVIAGNVGGAGVGGIPGSSSNGPPGAEYSVPEQDINSIGGSFNNVAQGLSGHYRNIMMSYWQDTINSIEHDDHEFKIHQLPLARIKKVMKADEDVKMISAEAPILFAKGCDVFITELTMRAWIHAEENKRRTLQRSDIANALQKSDMFDFLIDIVPREEAMGPSRKSSVQHGGGHHNAAAAAAAAAAASAAAAATVHSQGNPVDNVGDADAAFRNSQYSTVAGQQGAHLGSPNVPQGYSGASGIPQASALGHPPLTETDTHIPGQYPPGQTDFSQIPGQYPPAPMYGDLDNVYNGYRQY